MTNLHGLIHTRLSIYIFTDSHCMATAIFNTWHCSIIIKYTKNTNK